MEGIISIVYSIIGFLLELVVMTTWYALKFMYYALRAVFDAKYRQIIRDHWRESHWNKVMLLVGGVVYLGMFSLAGTFWWNLANPSDIAESRAEQNDPILKALDKYLQDQVEVPEPKPEEPKSLSESKTLSEMTQKLRVLKERLKPDGRQEAKSEEHTPLLDEME